jgi:ABC-type lipoprotein release transport system permease subunit
VTATESPLPGGVRLKDATAAARTVAALPQVAEAVALRTAEGEVALPGNRTERFNVMAADPGRRRPWTVITGTDIDGDAPAVLVNQPLFDVLSVQPGESVQLRVICDGSRALPAPRTFRLLGTAQFPFDDESQKTVVMARAVLREACGEDTDEADMLMVASKDGVGSAAAVSAIRQALPDRFPVTNEQIVARMQAQGFTYFRQISAVLSTITLLFGFLLITVLLTVSVNQRLGEIAALRALGFSRSRAAADVLWQGALLVGTGGILALPLGLALSVWLDSILKAMPGIPASMHFFVFEPRALWMHAALLVTTALLASAYPMWLVARLPIATTLRNEVVS